MSESFLDLLKIIIIPLIAIFAPIITPRIYSAFEKRKMKERYKELYFTVFAPLEKIKVGNANILDSIYTLKVEQILFDDKVYGLVPVEIIEAFNKMKTAEVGTAAEFQRIVDNNTNVLRQLQGMTYHYKEYNGKDVCVEGKSNATFILTIVMMVISSAWIALLVMYPEFANEAGKVFDKIVLFFLLFLFAFIVIAIVAGVVYGVGKLMEMAGESEGWKNKVKTIGKGLAVAVVVVALVVVILWVLVRELNTYDPNTLEKRPTSQAASSVADVSV